MAVDDNEKFTEKVKDFFTQKPDDRKYEELGGDDRVPAADRTDDPKADANEFAKKAGEPLPYPGHVRAGAEGSEVADSEAEKTEPAEPAEQTD